MIVEEIGSLNPGHYPLISQFHSAYSYPLATGTTVHSFTLNEYGAMSSHQMEGSSIDGQSPEDTRASSRKQSSTSDREGNRV